MPTPEASLADLLGPECSAVSAACDAGSGRAVAHAYFRNILLAASGADEAAAIGALREKVKFYSAVLRGAGELPAVEEVNLISETPGAQPARRFVRAMPRERAIIEFDLGVDAAFVFVDVATGRPTVAARASDGTIQFLCVGEPVHGDAGARPLAVPNRTPGGGDEARLRAGKAARIRELLRCPICKQSIADAAGGYYCTPCARTFNNFDGRPVLAVDPAYNPSPEGKAVSANTYGQQCLALIEENRNGWVLDCGSGSPSAGFYNVVHLELFAYLHVDVVTDGRALPFADATFDAVLSEAVLEHVKDPIAYLRGVARVMKPGAKVRLDAAFLQPFHGYPDHYFNMTKSGLALVVENAGLEVLAIEPGPHQRPWIALSLLLNGIVAGTPSDARRTEILNMTIGDALQRLNASNGAAFDALTKEAADRLAAGFGCLARKN